MSLQGIAPTPLNIDFYNKKYILINAKQYDKKSRFLEVTCYNRGQVMSINAGEHAAYIRYRQADENGVFNECQIDRKGKILVELTEQMLVADGICMADFVLVNKGDAKIDVDTGEVLYIDNACILSSMVFHIDVTEVPIDNHDIESSYEYNGLNTALEKAEAEYKEVIQLSKSYAIGNADGIRENENYDNAKYYYEQALNSADNAKNSEDAAYTYMGQTKNYRNSAETYKNDAYIYMTNAETYKNSALESKNASQTSEINAKTSEDNAKISETNASKSETNALSYKETIENINNNIIDSINTLASNGNIGSFIFIGTVTFEELISLSDDRKATGYVYCVTNDFVTNNSFVNGIGLSYTAGTNVYYTVDGYWNCLGGATSPTAMVDEVKDYLGIV